MDFFELRDQLDEARGGPASLKTILNKLQDHWNDNADLMLKNGVYPIMGNPLSDGIRRGGVLTIGINPGMGGHWHKIIDDWIKNVRKKNATPVFDIKTQTWSAASKKISDEITSGRNRPLRAKNPRLKKGSTQTFVKRSTRTGKFNADSKYTRQDWHATDNLESRPDWVSEFGESLYHSSINKIFDDIAGDDKSELSVLRSELNHANYLPFPSRDVDKLSSQVLTPQLKALCNVYIKHVMKLTKPKMIIVASNTFSYLSKAGLPFKVEQGSLNIPLTYAKETRLSASSYLKQDRSFYKTYSLNGVPVVVFGHWSSPRAGGPTNPTWKDDVFKREIIRADFLRLYRNGIGSTATVESNPMNKAIQDIQDYLSNFLTPGEIQDFFNGVTTEERSEIIRRMMNGDDAKSALSFKSKELGEPDVGDPYYDPSRIKMKTNKDTREKELKDPSKGDGVPVVTRALGRTTPITQDSHLTADPSSGKQGKVLSPNRKLPGTTTDFDAHAKQIKDEQEAEAKRIAKAQERAAKKAAKKAAKQTATLPVQTTREVKPAKQPAASKPSKAYLDPRFDDFVKANLANGRLVKNSGDHKKLKKDSKSMTYDDLLTIWAVPGKLKRL